MGVSKYLGDLIIETSDCRAMCERDARLIDHVDNVNGAGDCEFGCCFEV